MTVVSPLKVAVSMFLWLSLMGGLVVFYLWQWLYSVHHIPDSRKYFVVNSGESLKSVADRLYHVDLIRWPKVWVLYARFENATPIKKGEYQFESNETPISILNKLQSNDVVTYNITLIEGSTFTDYVHALSQQDKLRSKLPSLNLKEQLKVLNVDVEHQEGWFYPDTYQFIAGDTDVAILRRAHKKMKLLLESEWQNRADGLPYASPYEALIMASIIEKETGVAYERPEIAGVFVRRLQKGMRLQTDPTVIYGMGESYQGNLTRSHLKEPTPYNTYIIPGLPPTPIAMPSGASIQAALHPASGNTLYFVAKGDGSHYFSETLEQHNDAVKKYQIKNRKKSYRSSPVAK